MLAKKANILKVVDLILFLYRGIWSSLFLKLPAFLKFCSSPSNTICKFPHLFSQVPYGGCSPHVLNTCRRPCIKVMLMPLWHYDYIFLIIMIKSKREVLACELSFTGHSSPYSSHLQVTSFDFCSFAFLFFMLHCKISHFVGRNSNIIFFYHHIIFKRWISTLKYLFSSHFRIVCIIFRWQAVVWGLWLHIEWWNDIKKAGAHEDKGEKDWKAFTHC